MPWDPEHRDAHALAAGAIYGYLTQHGIQARVETDENGDYTNRLFLEDPQVEKFMETFLAGEGLKVSILIESPYRS